MNLMGSFVIAFSMYSKIPMPQIEWTRERMRYAMCFFPLIGVVTGAACALFFRVAGWAGAGPLFTALVGTALPICITGGIHVDGFLDVTDAIHSYGEREKKLEILKDPHTGAFAIIGLGVYLLLYAAAFSELKWEQIRLFAAVFVLERALSGLSVVSFPMAKKDGLAAQFSQAAIKRTVRLVMGMYLAASAVWLLWFGHLAGLLCIVFAGAVYLAYYKMSVREFGGITGDLAGYFLQCSELCLALVLAFCSLAGIGG